MASENKRCTNFMYVQQLDYLTLSIDDLKQRLNDDDDVKEFAMIIHDKDVKDDSNDMNDLVEPHLHAFISFKQQKSLNSVAKIVDDERNRIEFFNRDTVPEKNERNGFLYLLHRTKNSSHRHQYDINELILPDNSNLKSRIEKWERNYHKYLESTDSKRRKKVVKKHLEQYSDSLITFKELQKHLTSFELAQNRTLINNIDDLRLRRSHERYINSEIYKNKKVIWIYGASGVGKSLLSRRIAGNYVDDEGQIYVTSSNRDPFQNYFDEKVIILEEFRKNTGIDENELFQMLDKTNRSFSAGARYKDKLLMPELVIINSIHSPLNILESESFEVKQLLRRLDVVIEMDKLNIKSKVFDVKSKQFYDYETKSNDIYDSNNEKKIKPSLNNIMKGVI